MYVSINQILMYMRCYYKVLHLFYKEEEDKDIYFNENFNNFVFCCWALAMLFINIE